MYEGSLPLFSSGFIASTILSAEEILSVLGTATSLAEVILIDVKFNILQYIPFLCITAIL